VLLHLKFSELSSSTAIYWPGLRSSTCSPQSG